MFDKAHRYLDDKWRIDLTKDGLSFDIWALRFLFDDLGFTTKKGGKIPMFMRSSDYDPVDLKDITSFTPPERLPVFGAYKVKDENKGFFVTDTYLESADFKNTAGFVKKTGDTMSGVLNMGGHDLTNNRLIGFGENNA